MQHLVVFIIALSLISGTAAIVQASNIYRHNKVNILKTFIAFLFLLNFVGLLNFFSQYILFNISSLNNWTTYLVIMIIMGFIGFVLALIEIYLFSHLIWTLSGLKTANWFRLLYRIVCILWAITFGTGAYLFLLDDNRTFLMYQFFYMNIFLTLFLLTFNFSFLFYSRVIEPEKKRKSVRYLLSFFLFLSFLDCTGYFISARLNMVLLALNPLLLNAAVFIFIKSFLKTYLEDFSSPSNLQKSIEVIAQKFQISAREQEIIEMLIKGMSNKEIEQKLFISANTVKNHIYHIFQKTGVKSRAQLTNLILNHNN